MYTHPTITAALAEQHRRDLISQASASRQARAARQGSGRNPARRPVVVRALRTAAAATAIAAGAFLVIPAGPGHAPSAGGKWTVHSWSHSWSTSSQAGDSHRAVLAVHWKTRFAASHRFDASHVFGSRWS